MSRHGCRTMCSVSVNSRNASARRMLIVFCVATSIAQATVANAQPAKKITPAQSTPPGFVALMADSIANAGDSLAAYAMLDSALHENKHDAAAWHKYAMMAWSMARSSRKSTINSPRNIRWLLAADSAFHIAVSYAPDSAMYWRDLARFGMNSGNAFLRFRAEAWIEKGLGAAERSGDSLLVSDLANEAGMVKWHRYENIANQALEIEGAPSFSWEQARDGVAVRRDQLVKPPHSFPGFADYTEAKELFARAMNANPVDARSRHHFYMTLAERDQWPELLRVGNDRIKDAPWDYEAWLARGLACQRLFQSRDAAAAFDSALVLMTPNQVANYKRITRIIPSRSFDSKNKIGDSATFAKLGSAEQSATEEVLWALMDPLAVTPENEFRSEFYARVAFADLRWTAEDLDYRGSNTDRGDVHIRYGPPDRQLSIPGESFFTYVVWRYNSGFNFTFRQAPMFGTAHQNVASVNATKNYFPVRFDNVPIAKLIDTMTIRVTAFRSTRDSLDIVVASDIPAKKMLGIAEIGGDMPFTLSSRVIDGRAQSQQVQSRMVKINAATAPEQLPANWKQRVGAGANFVKVEAYQPDTRRIVHGTFSVTPDRPSGFGMSDILLGRNLSESNALANRWSDVTMQPTMGTYRVGEPIGMLWENYQLTNDGGNVRYKVDIDVRTAEGGGIKGVVARVRNALGATLGQGKENSGIIAVSFPRVAPVKDITVESMLLDLGKAKVGVYRLKVEVTDVVSGLKTARETTFQVVK